MKKKTPEQRQFEQVTDKFEALIAKAKEILELMPKKGNTAYECQRQSILCDILSLEHSINGIELEDFTPNEFSEDFKLSYS